MNFPPNIATLSLKLHKMGATSVFVYGSRARGDNLPDSDWEVGVLFTDDNYASRSKLSNLQTERVVIYPFRLSELQNGVATTPFTNSIWLNEVINTAKTVSGRDLVSELTKPVVTDIDMVADSAFYKARALDAMIAQREGHQELARDLFVKSVLLGSRVLMLANNLPFPENYSNIVRDAESLVDDEYKYLLDRALNVRIEGLSITQKEAFDNIGLQMYVETSARNRLGR